jgi:hypothetical protein
MELNDARRLVVRLANQPDPKLRLALGDKMLVVMENQGGQLVWVPT